MGVFMGDFTNGVRMSEAPEIMHWSVDCVYASNDPNPTCSALVDAVVTYVLGNDWMFTMPDIVLIEQQMESNPKMRAVSNALQATILACAYQIGHKTLRVKHVAPVLKYNRFACFCKYNRKTTTYHQRKENSKAICDAILNRWNCTWPEYSVSGNYDMADALTNACAYLLCTD